MVIAGCSTGICTFAPTVPLFSVWLDEKDLLPGDNWKLKIEDAINTSNFILVFFSEQSINKKDSFFHREINYAMERSKNNPDGTRLIIPLLIDSVSIPKKFSEIQCENISNSNWLERLALAMTPNNE